MNDRRRFEKATTDHAMMYAGCDGPGERADGGGLVALAERTLGILASCHQSAEAIDDAVTPPAPPGVTCSDKPMAPVADLTTLLREMRESALRLSDKLASIRDTIRG